MILIKSRVEIGQYSIIMIYEGTKLFALMRGNIIHEYVRRRSSSLLVNSDSESRIYVVVNAFTQIGVSSKIWVRSAAESREWGSAIPCNRQFQGVALRFCEMRHAGLQFTQHNYG